MKFRFSNYYTAKRYFKTSLMRMSGEKAYVSVLKFWFGDDLSIIDDDSYKPNYQLWFQTK